MRFFCVYVKTRKKFDKMIKINCIKNKIIIDLKKIQEEEEIEYDADKTYLKILVFQKIQKAIEKNKDIYYIPDFEHNFSIEKLLNIKKLLGVSNEFNVVIFFNEMLEYGNLLNEVIENLSKFDNSQILKDY
jgi:hypothetical protein